MKKYRIVKRRGHYIIQQKVLFFWMDVEGLSENALEFDTMREAEELIREWNEQDEVVKEVKYRR